MKKLICLAFILFTTQTFAQDEIRDVKYDFDSQKLEASQDAFHFTRSFVDYYYDVIAGNTETLKIARELSQYSGWCVGDAHAENFGILLQNDGKSFFTMNDMDDFGPCPLAYDFLRLLVSTRLYMPKADIEKLRSAYLTGLSGDMISAPDTIISMAKNGEKLGTNVDPKALDGNKFKRKNGMNEVSPEIRQKIIDDLTPVFAKKSFTGEDLKIVDVVATSKVGGGSGGLLRYEVLAQGNKKFVHLELKELTTPAVAAVATSSIPEQNARMMKALSIEQGTNYSHYYNVFTIGGKTMLLRPKFAGNLGVSLSDFDNKDGALNTIAYEAFILGRIHASSAGENYQSAIKNFSADDLEKDVSAFTKFINHKYDDLKKVAPVAPN